MPVSRRELEAHIATARSMITDPRAGLFGPETLTWEVNRESVVMLGGGCAALLQSAHPFVAHAIDQHSAVMTDIQGRFQRTFTNVFALTFGTWDEAEQTARHVHAVHRGIEGEIREDVGGYRHGDRYEANSVDALFWVHATLIDTATRLFELLVRPLETWEKDQLMREATRFSLMFGIPAEVVPQTWAAFDDYMQAMVRSDTLAVGAPARQIAHFILLPPNNLLRPVFAWLEVFTAGLLPPRIRQAYGLRWTRADAALFKASIQAMRLALRPLPPSLRYFPAYLDAVRRLEGRAGTDPVSRLLERLFMATLVGERPTPSTSHTGH